MRQHLALDRGVRERGADRGATAHRDAAGVGDRLLVCIGAKLDRAACVQLRAAEHRRFDLRRDFRVGNRALGDRIGDTISPGQQAIGAALYLLSPYTPMVFMGEEWRASTPFQYFTSFDDQWLADAVRKGRREEFAAHGWVATDVPDPQDPATRSASVLDWAESKTLGHTEMLEFYRELINTRRREPDARSGDLLATDVEIDEANGWLIMHRGRIHVVCNFRQRSQAVPLRGLQVDRVLVSWGRAPIVDEFGVLLDGHDVAVLRTR